MGNQDYIPIFHLCSVEHILRGVDSSVPYLPCQAAWQLRLQWSPCPGSAWTRWCRQDGTRWRRTHQRCNRRRRSPPAALTWCTGPWAWAPRTGTAPLRCAQSRQTSSWCKGSVCTTGARHPCRSPTDPPGCRWWGHRRAGWTQSRAGSGYAPVNTVSGVGTENNCRKSSCWWKLLHCIKYFFTSWSKGSDALYHLFITLHHSSLSHHSHQNTPRLYYCTLLYM